MGPDHERICILIKEPDFSGEREVLTVQTQATMARAYEFLPQRKDVVQGAFGIEVTVTNATATWAFVNTSRNEMLSCSSARYSITSSDGLFDRAAYILQSFVEPVDPLLRLH